MTGFFVALLLLSCDEELISRIPNAPVEISVYLKIEQQLLYATESFVKVGGKVRSIGFGGVLLIYGFDMNGGDVGTFYAYDLACPYEVDSNTRVIPDTEGKATCPRCGSVYDTMWGTGFPDINSVSKYPLKSYVVVHTGVNSIAIRN
ncbi:hypothetical protein FACS189421_02250 [Bacteroidia bacterium]|nr:hypothetical protein FACS189421_02250 [Bacteroidia bacterium]